MHLPVPCPPANHKRAMGKRLTSRPCLVCWRARARPRQQRYDPIIGWLPLLPCSAPLTYSPCLAHDCDWPKFASFPSDFTPKRGMNCSSPTSPPSTPSFRARLVLTSPYSSLLLQPLCKTLNLPRTQISLFLKSSNRPILRSV
jgi:hypothetical protein